MAGKQSLQQAILQTLCYADVFDYPLTDEEIQRWLICDPKNTSEVAAWTPRMVERAMKKVRQIDSLNDCYFLKCRRNLVNLRQNRQPWSRQKLKIAKRAAKWLKLIPTIKMVAVTGALAMENSDKNDDIDLMIVTSKDSLWLTRLAVISLVSLVSKRRKPISHQSSVVNHKDKICLNLFLDEEALAVPHKKRNLYTAHEVAQIKPLWSRGGTEEKFFSQNTWIKQYLPNIKINNYQELRNEKQNKSLLIIFRSLFSILEKLAFKLQLLYMMSKMTTEVVTPQAAFFHPRNTEEFVLKEYLKRLKSYR